MAIKRMREIKKILKRDGHQGVEVTVTKGTHLAVKIEGLSQVFYTSSTTSDQRSLLNLRARIKRNVERVNAN